MEGVEGARKAQVWGMRKWVRDGWCGGAGGGLEGADKCSEGLPNPHPPTPHP